MQENKGVLALADQTALDKRAKNMAKLMDEIRKRKSANQETKETKLAREPKT